MSDEVCTRFAPSPTDICDPRRSAHGLVYLPVRQKDGGKFILRIEDTDQEREVPGAVDLIYKSMRQARADL